MFQILIFFLIIVFVIFLVMFGMVGSIIYKVLAWLKGFVNPDRANDRKDGTFVNGSDDRSETKSGQVISNDEGEYVDFEEIKN